MSVLSHSDADDDEVVEDIVCLVAAWGDLVYVG